jgi:hypothetical protein
VDGTHSAAGRDPNLVVRSLEDSLGSHWLTDWAARASDVWTRAARAGVDVTAAFGARSLEDGDWTVETVTSGLIDASERLTPLVGEGIELWLEAVQRVMRVGPRGR